VVGCEPGGISSRRGDRTSPQAGTGHGRLNEGVDHKLFPVRTHTPGPRRSRGRVWYGFAHFGRNLSLIWTIYWKRTLESSRDQQTFEALRRPIVAIGGFMKDFAPSWGTNLVQDDEDDPDAWVVSGANPVG